MTSDITVWADLGPEWGRCLVSLGTVDPAYYPPKGPAQPVRETQPRIDPVAFASRAMVERARLALTDPIGEWGADYPMDHATAIRILERYSSRARSPAPLSITPGRRVFDPRAVLVKIGADPDVTSGRVPCPGHGGDGRNLSWKLDGDRILLHCFSHKCTFAQIMAAVR